MDSRTIFRPIVPVYDPLNRLLSFGMDQSWRRKAAREVLPGRVLDLACGTGDLALMDPGRVFGCDILPEMLLVAKKKIHSSGRSIPLIAARGEELPLRRETFESVTIAFGIRNFSDRLAGIKEIARVIKRGGRLVILEFAIPSNTLFKSLYLFYFLKVLPFIGRMISGNSRSYSYLPESVLAFPEPDRFSEELKANGFRDVRSENLTLGIVRLYVAER